jgi:cold shock CspA family protein
MKGTIGEVVVDRGFGFIDGEDGQRYFFHRNAIQGAGFEEMAPGVEVEFGIATEQNRRHGDEPGENPRAVNIRLTEGAAPAVDHEVLPAAKTR